MPEASGGWVEIRCRSAACLKACPDGRVLFRQKAGGIFSCKRRGQGVIGITPLFASCRCGYVWRNQSMLALAKQIEDLAADEIQEAIG